MRRHLSLGAGHSDVRVQVFGVSPGGLTLADEIEVNAKSGLQPGMAETMGASALTSHFLTEFPGIQSQIENFYDANVTEDDWICDSPQMNTIAKSQVVTQSATQVRLAVTYYFQSGDLSPMRGGNQCQGFNTRFFTFDRGPGGQLSLMMMSGAQ